MNDYVIWDGKDLAAIQMLPIPRRGGRPAVEVDSDWNLTVLDVPVPVGWRVYENGNVTPWGINIFTASQETLYRLLDQAEKDDDWAAIEEIQTELENRLEGEGNA